MPEIKDGKISLSFSDLQNNKSQYQSNLNSLISGSQQIYEQPGKVNPLNFEDVRFTGAELFEEQSDNSMYEHAADQQGFLNGLKTITGRFAGLTATKFGAGMSMLAGLPAAIVTGDIDNMTDNFMVNWFEDIENKVKDNLPWYEEYTQRYKDKNIYSKLFTPTYWNTTGVDGLAFMASAMIEGGLVGAALKSTGVGVRILEVATKLDDWSKIGKAAKKGIEATTRGTNLAKIPGSVNYWGAVGASAVTESAFEARGVQQAIKEKYEPIMQSELAKLDEAKQKELNAINTVQIPPSPIYDNEGNFVGWRDNTQSHKEQLIAQLEDKYSKIEQQINDDYKQKLQNAGWGTFSKNLPMLLVSNAIELAPLFKSFKGSSKAIEYGKKGAVRQMGFGIAKELGKQSIVQGSEEVQQLAISDYYTDKALGEEDRGWVEGIVSNYIKNYSTDEGMENFLAGAVTGFLPGGFGSYKRIKGEQEHEAKMQDIFNKNLAANRIRKEDLFQKDKDGNIIEIDGKPQIDLLKLADLSGEFISQMTQNEIMDQAAEAGNETAWDLARMRKFTTFAIPYLQENGTIEKLEQDIDNLAKEETEDNEKIKDLNKAGQPKSSQEIASEYKMYAKELQKIWDNVTQRHAGVINELINLKQSDFKDDAEYKEALKIKEEFVSKLLSNQYYEGASQYMYQEKLKDINSKMMSIVAKNITTQEAISKGEFKLQGVDKDSYEELSKAKSSIEKALEDSYKNFETLANKQEQIKAFKADLVKRRQDREKANELSNDLNNEELKKNNSQEANQWFEANKDKEHFEIEDDDNSEGFNGIIINNKKVNLDLETGKVEIPTGNSMTKVSSDANLSSLSPTVKNSLNSVLNISEVEGLFDEETGEKLKPTIIEWLNEVNARGLNNTKPKTTRVKLKNSNKFVSVNEFGDETGQEYSVDDYHNRVVKSYTKEEVIQHQASKKIEFQIQAIENSIEMKRNSINGIKENLDKTFSKEVDALAKTEKDLLSLEKNPSEENLSFIKDSVNESLNNLIEKYNVEKNNIEELIAHTNLEIKTLEDYKKKYSELQSKIKSISEDKFNNIKYKSYEEELNELNKSLDELSIIKEISLEPFNGIIAESNEIGKQIDNRINYLESTLNDINFRIDELLLILENAKGNNTGRNAVKEYIVEKKQLEKLRDSLKSELSQLLLSQGINSQIEVHTKRINDLIDEIENNYINLLNNYRYQKIVENNNNYQSTKNSSSESENETITNEHKYNRAFEAQTHQNLFHTSSAIRDRGDETKAQLRWGMFTSKYSEKLFPGIKLMVIKPDTDTKNNEFGIKYDSVDGSLKGLNDETLYVVVVNKDGKPINSQGKVTENPNEMLYNSLLDSEPNMQNIDSIKDEEKAKYKDFRLKLHNEFKSSKDPIYLGITGTTKGIQAWDKKDGDNNNSIVKRIWESIPKTANKIIHVITNKIEGGKVGSVTITTQFGNEVQGISRKILNEEADNIIAMLRVVSKNFLTNGSYNNAFQFKDNTIEFDLSKQISGKIYFGLFTNRKLRNLPISKAIGFKGNYLYFGNPNNNSRLNPSKNIDSQLNKIHINDLANIEQHPELKAFLINLYHNVSSSHLGINKNFKEFVLDNTTLKVKKTNNFKNGYGEYLLSGDNPALGTNARSMFVGEAESYQDLPFKNRHLTFSDKYNKKTNEDVSKGVNEGVKVYNKLIQLANLIKKTSVNDLSWIMDEIFTILNEEEYTTWQDTLNENDLAEIKDELNYAKSEEEITAIVSKFLLVKFIAKKINEIKNVTTTTKKEKVEKVTSNKTIRVPGEYEVIFSVNGSAPKTQIVETKIGKKDEKLFLTIESYRHVGKFKQEFKDSLLNGIISDNIKIIKVKQLNVTEEIIPESNQSLEELLNDTTKEVKEEVKPKRENKFAKRFSNREGIPNNDFGRPGNDEEISKLKKIPVDGEIVISDYPDVGDIVIYENKKYTVNKREFHENTGPAEDGYIFEDTGDDYIEFDYTLTPFPFKDDSHPEFNVPGRLIKLYKSKNKTISDTEEIQDDSNTFELSSIKRLTPEQIEANKSKATKLDISKDDKTNWSFRKASLKSSEQVENFNKFKEWANKNLPKSISILIEQGLIDGMAFGKFYQDVITLSNIAEIGTGYHEAFHAVSLRMLSREKRNAIYNEYRRLNNASALTDNEVEEKLAEGFREFMLNKKSKSKFGKLVNKFFESLLELVKSILNISSSVNSINELYEHISNGKFSDAQLNDNYNSIVSYSSILPGMELKDSKQLIKAINITTLEYIADNRGVELVDMFSNSLHNIKFDDKEIEEAFEFAIDDIAEFGMNEISEYVLENKSKILKAAKEEIRFLNLKVREDEVEEENKRKDSAYDKDATKIDVSSEMYPAVKLLLSIIKTGSNSLFGIDEYYDYNEVRKTLLKELTGTTNLYEINKILNDKKLQDKYPYISKVIDAFKLNVEPENITKSDFYLQQQFRQCFNNTRLKSLTYIHGDNGLYAVDSNSENVASDLLNTWKINSTLMAQNNQGALMLVNGEPRINGEKLKEIVYKDDKEWIIKKNLDLKQSVIKFYDLLGIELNKENLSKESLLKLLKTMNYIMTDTVEKDNSLISLYKTHSSALFDAAIISINQEDLRQADAQYRGADGETRYEIIEHNNITILVDALKHYDTLNELLENHKELSYLNPESNPAIKTSVLFNMIFEPLGNSGYSIKKDINFNAVLIGGSKINNENGDNTSDLSIGDLTVLRIFSVLSGTSPFIRSSDKGNEYGLKMPFETATLNRKSFVFEDDDLYETMLNYFAGESFQQMQIVNNTKFSKNVSTKGIFSSIITSKIVQSKVNDIKLSSDNIIDDIINEYNTNDEFRNEFDNNISDYFDKLSDKIINNKLLAQGIIEKKAGKNRGYKNIGLTIPLNSSAASFEFNKDFSEIDIKNITKYFVINDFVYNFEQTLLFTGNLSNYKNPADVIKRMSAFTGTKQYPSYDKNTTEVINSKFERADGKNVNGDVKIIISPDISNQLTELKSKDGTIIPLGNILSEQKANEYKKITETDGIMFIGLEYFREWHLSLGKWNDAFERSYQYYKQLEAIYKSSKNKTELNEKLSKVNKPIDLISFPSRKPQIAGQVKDSNNDANGTFVPFFGKCSFEVIIPHTQFNVTDTEIEQSLLGKLNDWMFDNQIDIYAYDSTAKSNYFNTDSTTIFDIFENNESIVGGLNILHGNSIGNQVETNEEQHEKVTLGSQNQSLRYSDFYENGVDTGVTVKGKGKQFYGEKLDELSNMFFEENKNALLKRLGIERSGNDYKIKDYKSLVKIIQEEITSRDLNQDVVDALNMLLTETPGENKYPINIMVESDRVEPIILALLSKTIRAKVKGTMAFQVPVTGWTVSKENIVKSNSNELAFYSVDKDGFTQPMEIITTLPKELKNIVEFYFNNDLDKFNEYVTNNPEQFTLTAFRTPTSGPNSIECVRVKRFTDSSLGDQIVLPSAIVIKSGTDYDIDKMSIYFYNWIYNKEKKKLEVLTTKDNNSVDSIQNELIQIQNDITLSPENIEALLSPISTAELEKVAKHIKNISGDNNENNVTYADILTSDYLLDISIKFWSSKSLVGMQAVHNTSHQKALKAGLQINKSLGNLSNITTQTKIKSDFNNSTELFFEGNLGYSLSKVRDTEGTKISETLNAQVNGIIDAVKNPFIFDMGIDGNTIAISNYLYRRGLSPTQVALFLNQPIIKMYLRELSKTKSQFIKNYGKISNDDFIKGRASIIKEVFKSFGVTKDFTVNSNIAFSNKRLEEMIKEKNGTKEEQLQILRDFLRYDEQARFLGELIRASAADRKGAGINWAENLSLKQTYESIRDKNIFTTSKSNKNGVDEYIGSNLSKTTEIAFGAEDYFGELDIKFNESVKNLVEPIESYFSDKRMKGDSKIKIYKTLHKFLQAYIFNVVPSKWNSGNDSPISLHQKFNELFKGSNAIQYRIEKAKKEIDNAFLNILFTSSTNDTRKNHFYNIGLINKRFSPEQISEYKDAITDLYETHPKLVKDIFFAGLLESGIQNSPRSFIHLFPSSIKTDFAMDIYGKFIDNSELRNGIDVEHFRDSFFANNTSNFDIVPKIKITEHDSSVYISGDILIVSSVNYNYNYDYIQSFKKIGDAFEKTLWKVDSIDEATNTKTYKKLNIKGMGLYHLEITPSYNSVHKTNNRVNDTRKANGAQFDDINYNEQQSFNEEPEFDTYYDDELLMPEELLEDYSQKTGEVIGEDDTTNYSMDIAGKSNNKDSFDVKSLLNNKEKEDAVKVLENIKNNGETEYYQNLASKLMKLDNLNVDVKLVSSQEITERANNKELENIVGLWIRYDSDIPKFGEVWINKDAENLSKRLREKAILHEIIHAVTEIEIDRNTKYTKKIQELYDYALANGLNYNPKTKEGFYGMYNLKEFVSEAYSNGNFQTQLASIKSLYGNKSLLHDFFEFVRKVITFAGKLNPGEASLLDDIFAVTNEEFFNNVIIDQSKLTSLGSDVTVATFMKSLDKASREQLRQYINNGIIKFNCK